MSDQRRHDIFSEGQPSGEDDFFQGQGQPAQPQGQPPGQAPGQQPPPPQQPPASPPRQFIPEGYEPREALMTRRTNKQREAQALRNRLDKAGSQDPAQNPYADIVDGKPHFNQFRYDADNRSYNTILSDISDIDRRLSENTTYAERLGGSVRQLARAVWDQFGPTIPERYREGARTFYSQDAMSLIDQGHFASGSYRSTEEVMAALRHLAQSSLGRAVMAGTQGTGAPPQGTQTGGEDGDRPVVPDEFKNWEPEAVKMFQAGVGYGNDRQMTLADKAKADRERQQAQQPQGQGGSGR